MKCVILYHRVDFDGVFSCYITKKALENNGEQVDVVGYNYGDPLPPDLLGYGKIYMVDISLPADEMKKYGDSEKLVWIDHHLSKITESKELGYEDIPGLRVDGTAACELCWKYFYGDKEEPKLLQYIGTYDVFSKSRFTWEDVLILQYGIKSECGVSLKGIEDVKDLFSDEFFSRVYDRGRIILGYQRQSWKYQVKNYSFPVTVQGKYRGLAMLTPTFTSLQFDDFMEGYDMCLCLNRKGPDCYNLSIYVKDECEFDAGDFARTVLKTGGGHPKAAGMTLTLEQFEKILVSGELNVG